MSRQKAPLASDKRTVGTETPVAAVVGKPDAAKAPKARRGAASDGAADASASVRRIELLRTRIAELEDLLLQSELNSSQALSARLRRLEKDVATYREARAAAEFNVTDLRASLDRSAAMLERARASPAYQLGSLLVAAGQNWKDFVRLPASLARWTRESRRHQAMIDAQLIQVGSATEYTEPVERALEIADKRGYPEAESWAVDQRLRAPVLARVLSELAGAARRLDPQEAVRLAEAALEADPNEARVKRLAFIMGEAGSVTLAAQLLRTAMQRGAPFNPTEEARAEELLALAELGSNGLTLIPNRRLTRSVDAADRRVLIFTPQAFPFHWSSASIRTHAMASSLIEAGIAVSVATPPGYPNVGRPDPVEHPPTRTIDGVEYHLLRETSAAPGVNDDYIRQASLILASTMRRLEASILIAPSDLVHGYPGAAAAQTAGASLVLDCWSVSAGEAQSETERGQILSRAESQLFQYARLALARTPAIQARLQEAATEAAICVVPDTTPRTASTRPAEARAPGAEFVFGYVGDNSPDVDIECLVTVLDRLVKDGVDARLIVHSVGGRIRALGDQLELAGLANKSTLNEKSPPGRRTEVAYSPLDALIVPFRPSSDVLKSPFQILAGIRQHKCVVAMHCEEYSDMFGPALLRAADLEAAVQMLSELAKDASARQRQEAEARLWDERHPSAELLVQALEAL
jgi:hypothetical protein